MFVFFLAVSQLAINILEDLAEDIAKMVEQVDSDFQKSIMDYFIYKQYSNEKQSDG